MSEETCIITIMFYLHSNILSSRVAGNRQQQKEVLVNVFYMCFHIKVEHYSVLAVVEMSAREVTMRGYRC